MSDRLATIGDYVEQAMASWKIPGTALAVIRGNDVLHMAGYGSRNLESKEPVTPETRFAIASSTKAFTAMGVALLVDDGVVEWDKPVREYLPTFKLQDSYAAEKITLRDMLCHRSGLPRHDLSWYNAPFTREQLVQNVAHHEPSLTFREGWQYQNLMFVTAGYITGLMAHTHWEDFIQTRIFDKLGMTASSFAASEMRQSDNYAMPYRIKRGEVDTVEKMDFYDNQIMGPAGSIHSNLTDLAKWLKVHLNDGQSDGVQLISPANLAQMHQPQMVIPVSGINARLFKSTISTYGLGWFIEPYRGYTFVHHGGNIDGFSVIVSFVPEEKLGVIVLTNADGKPLRDILSREVLDRVLDLPDSDWNTKFHAVYSEMYKAQDQEKDTTDTERVPDTTPSHPLPDYAGEYTAVGYANFNVKVEDDHLLGWLGGAWYPLEHYHYDVFILNLERFELRLKVSFVVDTRGTVASVVMPIEPTVKDVSFKRKPVEVSAEDLAAAAGVYDMPFDGVVLMVALKAEGKLFVAMTGQSETELIPYKASDGSIEFNLKGAASASIEFTDKAADGYHLATIKQFGAVFKAPRLLEQPAE